MGCRGARPGRTGNTVFLREANVGWDEPLDIGRRPRRVASRAPALPSQERSLPRWSAGATLSCTANRHADTSAIALDDAEYMGAAACPPASTCRSCQGMHPAVRRVTWALQSIASSPSVLALSGPGLCVPAGNTPPQTPINEGPPQRIARPRRPQAPLPAQTFSEHDGADLSRTPASSPKVQADPLVEAPAREATERAAYRSLIRRESRRPAFRSGRATKGHLTGAMGSARSCGRCGSPRALRFVANEAAERVWARHGFAAFTGGGRSGGVSRVRTSATMKAMRIVTMARPVASVAWMLTRSRMISMKKRTTSTAFAAAIPKAMRSDHAPRST